MYFVNEIFYSLQGEGARVGTPNVFVRFAGCNLRCRVETHGFDCDTEFTSGVQMTAQEIVNRCVELAPRNRNVILTGGEPLLQVDRELLWTFKNDLFFVAVETNGAVAEPPDAEGLIDWFTVSPKVAEHAIKIRVADEVKYVRGVGQALPKTVVSADHYLISPAFIGDAPDVAAIQWCIQLCLNNDDPNRRWKLTLQTHKLLQIR